MGIHRGICKTCSNKHFLNDNGECFWCYEKILIKDKQEG